MYNLMHYLCVSMPQVGGCSFILKVDKYWTFKKSNDLSACCYNLHTHDKGDKAVTYQYIIIYIMQNGQIQTSASTYVRSYTLSLREKLFQYTGLLIWNSLPLSVSVRHS